jgi:hypothetical protein
VERGVRRGTEPPPPSPPLGERDGVRWLSAPLAPSSPLPAASDLRPPTSVLRNFSFFFRAL